MKAEEILDEVHTMARSVLGTTAAGQVRLMLSEYTDRLREAGLLLEWHPNNPETAETLAAIYGSIPVNVTYVKDGKIKEVFEVCAVDAHLYSPFSASHLAIIKLPEQTND